MPGVRPTATAFALLLAAAAKVNWQTALYLGYGDERALDEGDDLRRTSRQLFAKVSYAFQR